MTAAHRPTPSTDGALGSALPATSALAEAGVPLHLAWAEFQRRQVSMAPIAGFACRFLPLRYKGRNHVKRALHYLLLGWRTLALLRAERPRVLWLQLPQMPLLWTALFYRALFDRRVRLVADCHNAVFTPPWSKVPFGLSLLPRCDVVLVHNEHVRTQALAAGLPAERTLVLEDVPPSPGDVAVLSPADSACATRAAQVPPLFNGRPRPWVLFPGSYSRDEPVAEVLEAARLLTSGTVTITGRITSAARNGHDLSNAPSNVLLAGYLPVAEFDALLAHCDLVLALTKFDGIQLSVCNEALGVAKPMVMSNTPLLRELFGSAAVAVDSADPAAIARGVAEAWQCAEGLSRAATVLALRRREHWRAGPWRAFTRVLEAGARA
jgi:glycosyltransferase involved in cell wall biosynthesis